MVQATVVMAHLISVAELQSLMLQRFSYHNLKDTLFFECSHFRDPDKALKEYDKSHIRGFAFIHLINDLSEPGYTRPSNRNDIARRLGKLGIRDTSQKIVLCSRYIGDGNLEHDKKITLQKRVARGMMTATRAWWVLRSWGFNNLHILDGGVDVYIKYKNRIQMSSNVDKYPAANFDLTSLVDNSQLKATTEDVLHAIKDTDTTILDTLPGWPNTAGKYLMRAGRKESGGHIATAVHQECFSLVGDDGLFLPKKTLVKSFRNSFDINKPLVAY